MGPHRYRTGEKGPHRPRTAHRRKPTTRGWRFETRSGRDAVQLRDDGHDLPLEAVQSVLPVLLVLVQIRVHAHSARGTGWAATLADLRRPVPDRRRLAEPPDQS